jgi:tetratricopeptide (TPR) repeat protein
MFLVAPTTDVIDTRVSSIRALLLRDYTDETVRANSQLVRMLATHARRLAGFARPTSRDAERSADLVRLSLATTRLTSVVPSPSEWLQLVESIHDDLPADSISRPRLRLESGQCLVARGDELARAVELFEAGIAECRAVQSSDPDIPDWCESGIHNAYAECLQKLSRGPADLDHAEAHYTTALDLAHVDRHPDRGWFELQQLNNIATVHFVRGRLDTAAALFDEVIQRADNSDGVGRSIPIWLMNRLNVGVRRAQIAREHDQTDAMTARLASSLTIGRQVLRRTRRTLGPRHPQVARVLRTLAVVERERQRLDRSEHLLRLAISLLTHEYGTRGVLPVAEIEAVLADLLALTPSRLPEARELAQVVLSIFEHAYPAGSSALAEARSRLERLSAQA